MSEKFLFELVSPEKLLLSETFALVTVPGGEGDYGVLAGHAPMITTVRPGVIETFLEEDAVASDRIFVAGGFAEVTPENCTVLAEEAIPVAKLDRPALLATLSTLRDDQALAKTDLERRSVDLKVTIIEAKLAAIGTDVAH